MRVIGAWLIGVVVLAASSALTTSHVYPLYAQASGQIAHLRPDGTVWLTYADSGETEQLTELGGFSSVEWAPDGKRLLLVSGGPTSETPGAIHVLDVESREAVKVADGYAPVWSSDGQHILYVSNFTASEEGTEQGLMRYDLESGTDEVLVAQRWISGLWPIQRIEYSADERFIAVYVSGLEFEGQIVVVDSEGSLVWEIPDFVYSARGFDWSAQGAELVYRDSGQPFMGGEEPSLKIVRADTQETELTFGEAGFWPRWSPDGEHIAALLWAEWGGFQVMVVDRPAEEVTLVSEMVLGDLWDSEVTWSPDSSSILFTSSDEGQGEVHLMRLDGGMSSIAQGENPVVRWSPDGTRIAMAVGEGEAGELYIVGADGSGLHRVADGRMPSWRPVTEAEPGPSPVCGLPLAGSAGAALLALAALRVHSHREDGSEGLGSD